MSLFNWITKDRQKKYAINLEKQLLWMSVKNVHLEEQVAYYKSLSIQLDMAVKSLLEHFNTQEDSAPAKKGRSNVIILKPKRKPKK